MLNKPDSLAGEDVGSWVAPAEEGARGLLFDDAVRGMRDVVPGVSASAERFDAGYAGGLKKGGRGFRPAAGIVLVFSDTFDADDVDASLPEGAARADGNGPEIRRCSGTQFDPRLAEVFVDLVERGLIRPIESTEALVPASREGGRP